MADEVKRDDAAPVAPDDLTQAVPVPVVGERGGDTDPGLEASASAAAGTADPKPPTDIRKYLPWVGLGIAFWATMPQWSGPKLNTEPAAEVADHIVPGILIFVACLVALAVKPKEGPGVARFFAGMAVLLAGFWMVATHVGLLAQAFRGDAPWPATLYHSSTAFAVMGFGLLWTVLHWSDLAAVEAVQAQQKSSKEAASS